KTLPSSIHITENQEVVHLLGTWIGNNVDNAAPWEAVLNEIGTALSWYQQDHATLLMKMHLVQFGRTPPTCPSHSTIYTN
ncbi:hypothetical protein NEOLEDRAFT_1070952, partial [Neolentinus lepideus HHB14362 ss-1]